MNKMLKRKRLTPYELDSFFDSKIAVFINDTKLSSRIDSVLRNEGFTSISYFTNCSEFAAYTTSNKHDLIIIDLDACDENKTGIETLEMIRGNDPDSAIITLSTSEPDTLKLLENNVANNFRKPVLLANLVKASKRAIGDKTNYEIGMQFFDALFGMQMCTHRDLHQRTFDHVIRTTKIYSKFLLFLSKNGHIELTSWAMKNCLMASLVHDIGKLLVMHGVLYKEGKLSDFEYHQIKKHPWHSVTALLGGQDIDFFAKNDGPIETVSGYNEKNIGSQVQKWIFKTMQGDSTAFDDIESYFTDLSDSPFVHSLNKDLLYIVFRHHDGINESYHTPDEIQSFGKIIGRTIEPHLSAESPLDVVTNALSLCDMFDALLDRKRDYRKTHFSSVFALFLLYSEMRNGKFFPFLIELFIKFIVENERMEIHNPFYKLRDGQKAFKAIESMYELFRITKSQESDFNEFLKENEHEFETYAINQDSDGLSSLNEKWTDYFTTHNFKRIDSFLGELKKAKVIDNATDVRKLSVREIKVFDLLLNIYYSFNSPQKQKKFISFIIHNTINPLISPDVAERIAGFINAGKAANKRELENLLLIEGYDRYNVFDIFSRYDENTLVNDLNDFIRRQGS